MILGAKVTGLFKRGPSHLDYPVSEEYTGPLESTSKGREVDGDPLQYHITTIPSSFHYDSLPQTKERRASIKEESEEHGKSLGEKIGSLFKKAPNEMDFPISEEYTGPLENTSKGREVDDHPISHYVSVYHSGQAMTLKEGSRLTWQRSRSDMKFR